MRNIIEKGFSIMGDLVCRKDNPETWRNNKIESIPKKIKATEDEHQMIEIMEVASKDFKIATMKMFKVIHTKNRWTGGKFQQS